MWYLVSNLVLNVYYKKDLQLELLSTRRQKANILSDYSVTQEVGIIFSENFSSYNQQDVTVEYWVTL